jgi:hypothetical protein
MTSRGTQHDVASERWRSLLLRFATLCCWAGFPGTLEAKEQGVIDVYRYYTHTFHLPLKLRHPYRDRDCLKCHAEATKWIAAHQDCQEAIFAGKMSCMQCHAEANPAHNVVAQELHP